MSELGRTIRKEERDVMRAFEMKKLINGQFLDGKTWTPQHLALFTPTHSLTSPSQSFTNIFFKSQLTVGNQSYVTTLYTHTHTHTHTHTRKLVRMCATHET